MNKAIELAEIYGENPADAALAGLTHDIAKEIPYEESMKIIYDNDIFIDEIEMANPGLIHGPLGAFIIKERYGFNEKIQEAVRLHTRTSRNMNLLDKIIYISDKIEDGRMNDNYDIQKERELAKENIDEAMIMIIDNNIIHLLQKGKLVHPNAIDTTNYLKMNIKNSTKE